MEKPAGKKGLSFLEIILATGILGLGLVPLTMLLSGSLGRVKVSRPDFMAGTLATEVLDQMRLVPFAALPVSPIVVNFVPGTAPSGIVADQSGHIPLILGAYPVAFNLSVSVQPSSPPDLLAQITVTITWPTSSTVGAATASLVRNEWMENRLLRPSVP